MQCDLVLKLKPWQAVLMCAALADIAVLDRAPYVQQDLLDLDSPVHIHSKARGHCCARQDNKATEHALHPLMYVWPHVSEPLRPMSHVSIKIQVHTDTV